MRKWIACLTALLCVAIAPPAGAALVFNKGAGSAQPSVWSASDDGSGQKRIAAGGLGPRISPDGRTVAYQSLYASHQNPQLLTVPTAGGKRSVMLDPLWAADTLAWAPDSRTIAAVTGREVGTKRLVLIDVASGVVLRTVASGYFYGVSFSPTGGAVVYSRAPKEAYPLGSSLWVAPTNGGAPVRITSGHSDVYPLWGPQAVVFARQRRAPRRYDSVKQDLFLIAPGQSARRLTFQKPGFLMTGLAPVSWSADGTRLLGQFGGQDTAFAQTIDPLSGTIRMVGRQSQAIVGSALSRDGTTVLATAGGFEGGDPGNVVAVPYDGGQPKVLVKHAFSPDWNR